MLFQSPFLVGALHHVRLGIVAHGRVCDCLVLQLRVAVLSVAFGVAVLPRCHLCQDSDYVGVKLIVHLFSQVIPALAVAMVVLFALFRLHDYVALYSHAFDVMSFLPEVTSQPSHISVCGIMTHSSVSSAQPCSAGAHLCV